MTSGGARSTSGPAKDPNSLRSLRAGVKVRELPHAGYDGKAPDFPLPDASFHERSLWAWAWKQPQAVAWADEQWRWPIVAMWVRTFVRCASDTAKTAEVQSLHRLGDQIGMTPAGLRDNGWQITKNVSAPAEQVSEAVVDVPDTASARGRLRAITGGAAS